MLWCKRSPKSKSKEELAMQFDILYNSNDFSNSWNSNPNKLKHLSTSIDSAVIGIEDGSEDELNPYYLQLNRNLIGKSRIIGVDNRNFREENRRLSKYFSSTEMPNDSKLLDKL